MINKVIIVGRITKDAEVKKTQSGISTCRFSVALDKKDGVDYITCQAWRQSAEFMGMYVRKGDVIGVDGKLTTYTYEREGVKINATEVIADYVKRISGKDRESTMKSDTASESAENAYLDDLGKELPF